MKVYHLSIPLATTLSSAGVLACGNFKTGLDLNALAAHNKIEHDASLVHADAEPGSEFAPIPVDEKLLNALLEANPHGFTIDDLARARVEREMGLETPLGTFHEEIGHGEAGLTYLLMKNDEEVVPVETLRQWYGEERIPDSYIRPVEEVSLVVAKKYSNAVGAAMKKLETPKL